MGLFWSRQWGPPYTNPSLKSRFGYTGREFDAETGLQFNRARYYDPATGRWVSQDPKGFAAGDVNLYRYVGNGPVNATDPSGLEGWTYNDTLAYLATDYPLVYQWFKESDGLLQLDYSNWFARRFTDTYDGKIVDDKPRLYLTKCIFLERSGG